MVCVVGKMAQNVGMWCHSYLVRLFLRGFVSFRKLFCDVSVVLCMHVFFLLEREK